MIAPEPDKGFFPTEDVEASFCDLDLQRDHPIAALSADQRHHFELQREKAIQGGATENARWIYFSSPAWTWEQECGREGWLLYDPETRTQRGFVLTAMN